MESGELLVEPIQPDPQPVLVEELPEGLPLRARERLEESPLDERRAEVHEERRQSGLLAPAPLPRVELLPDLEGASALEAARVLERRLDHPRHRRHLLPEALPRILGEPARGQEVGGHTPPGPPVHEEPQAQERVRGARQGGDAVAKRHPRGELEEVETAGVDPELHGG